jgi:hypothetical protein
MAVPVFLQASQEHRLLGLAAVAVQCGEVW